jgi:hypothetical protein
MAKIEKPLEDQTKDTLEATIRHKEIGSTFFDHSLGSCNQILEVKYDFLSSV